jgi:hypothetical protein
LKFVSGEHKNWLIIDDSTLNTTTFRFYWQRNSLCLLIEMLPIWWCYLLKKFSWEFNSLQWQNYSTCSRLLKCMRHLIKWNSQFNRYSKQFCFFEKCSMHVNEYFQLAADLSFHIISYARMLRWSLAMIESVEEREWKTFVKLNRTRITDSHRICLTRTRCWVSFLRLLIYRF